MHVVDIERADGTRWQVTLRRARKHDPPTDDEHDHSTPEGVSREFRVLGLLEQAGVPAPRPLLLDAEGELFGVPAMALSYLPGRSIFPVAEVAFWTEGLAAALVDIHHITPDRYDLSWLPVADRASMCALLGRYLSPEPADPLSREVHRVLISALERFEVLVSNLIHDDFWPGNTVWHRRRLASVIDWSDASLGDARSDVATCRVDLVMSHGLDVADAFLHDYERHSGAALSDLWFYDLYRGSFAFAHHSRWIAGYHDIGLPHLREEDVAERLRAFLRRVLEEASST